MNHSVSILRCFHRHAVYSKAKPLFREKKLPNSEQKRNSVDSSSGKWKKQLDIKLTTHKKHSDKEVNENEKTFKKVNIHTKKQSRKTPIEIDEVAAEKMVLYKDSDILALNKPGGLAVHSGPKLINDLSSYLTHWQYDADHPPELAHRLDKDTSGVLLLTRHKEAAKKLAQLFKERKIIKKYWAVTVSVPEHLEGVIQIPLTTKNIATSGSMTRVVLRSDKMFKYTPSTLGKTLPGGVSMAETQYVVLGVSSLAPSRCCLMEVSPVTGFKHQIRVHLADGLNCPILGDHKFAGPVLRASPQLKKKVEGISKTSHLHLHAREIALPGYLAATGKPLVIKAPPPGYFTKTATEQGLHLPLT